jgi:hypothetical protein
MSDFYGPADEAESIATIRAALDAGITLLDTGDYYGMGSNELLIREGIRGREREQVVLSVKFGLMRAPDGSIVGNDLRPEAVKNFLAYTLRRPRHRLRRHLRPGASFRISDRGHGRSDQDGPSGLRPPSASRRWESRRSAAPTPYTRHRLADQYSLLSWIEAEIAVAVTSVSASPRTACSRAAC